MKRRTILPGLCLALAMALPASSQELYSAGSGVFATGVKVAPGLSLYFSSGLVGTRMDGPTMKEQALATMKRLEANIAAAGSTLSDVVYVRAYLRPGTNGLVDYAGWEQAWSETFTGATKPARATVGVPLANANSGVIELEYVTVVKDAAKMAAASTAMGLPAPNPNVKPFGTKDGRILAGAATMPGTGLYFTAGLTAPVIDRQAPPNSYESRGDMYTQAKNTLQALKDNIAQAGLTLGDVVFVRTWVGPDVNKGGVFDTDAWNKAYGEFFNNPDQPHKPARVTMTTPTFAGNAGGQPISMIEIEFVAAFPKMPALFEGAENAGTIRREQGAPTALFASGVAGKPGTSLYLSSGALPAVGGDMKTQALSALESLKSGLAQAGASFKDVVFLRAYLVPNADGSVDREGWNQAYSTFFNLPGQPNKPGRVTIPVLSLPKTDSRISIDVVAVVP